MASYFNKARIDADSIVEMEKLKKGDKMGIGAEMLEDIMYREDFEECEYCYADLKVWTTRDGRKMFFFEMTDTHLLNVFNMINKNTKQFPYELLREIKTRGLIDITYDLIKS